MHEELEELEASLWHAETRFDRAWMEHVLAADFFEFGRSGRRYSREQILDVSDAHEIRAKLPLEAFTIHAINETTVLTTYVSETAHDGGIERANRSSLWSKAADGWKLRFHQGTPTL